MTKLRDDSDNSNMSVARCAILKVRVHAAMRLVHLSQESDQKSQDEIFVLLYERFSCEYLPPIQVLDLLSRLVLETSYYTNKQFKALKSLNAYN